MHNNGKLMYYRMDGWKVEFITRPFSGSVCITKRYVVDEGIDYNRMLIELRRWYCRQFKGNWIISLEVFKKNVDLEIHLLLKDISNGFMGTRNEVKGYTDKIDEWIKDYYASNSSS